MMLSINFKHIILFMKQKNFKLVWLIIAVMVLAFVPKDAEAKYAVFYSINVDDTPKGEGTLEKPYEIENKNHLYWFVALVNGTLANVAQNQSACAKLMKDITVNEDLLTKLKDDGTIKDEVTDDVYRWTPIGTDNKQFLGTFDGNNFAVCGLYIYSLSTYQGLFGYCGKDEANTGTIKNVVVKDSYIKGSNNVGGVCGYNVGGTISNCYNTGIVKATGSFVGGVCGCNKGGTIQYERTNLTVGSYGTICMPYNVDANGIDGAEFYSIAGKEEKDGTVTSVYLTKVESSLTEGQPYIFKATTTTMTCKCASAFREAKEAGSRNGLIGSFEEKDVPEGDGIYVLKNNNLYKRGTQPWKIAAGRAYIDLSQIATPSSAPSKGVIKIGVSGGGTTGIGAVTAEHDNVYYNLQGQRVTAPSRGIYIVNGKKVIIK